jgi:hypothetical protein
MPDGNRNQRYVIQASDDRAERQAGGDATFNVPKPASIRSRAEMNGGRCSGRRVLITTRSVLRSESAGLRRLLGSGRQRQGQENFTS